MAANECTTAFVTGAGGFCCWLRLLFGLQLLSCFTAPVEALEEAGPRPAMHLVWIDVSQSAGFAFEPMAAEVDSLLGKVGVDVAWTRAEPSMSVTADTFTIVVLGSEARRPERRRRVMAAQLGRDLLLWPGTEIEPALAAPFLAGLAAWPIRLDDSPQRRGG